MAVAPEDIEAFLAGSGAGTPPAIADGTTAAAPVAGYDSSQLAYSLAFMRATDGAMLHVPATSVQHTTPAEEWAGTVSARIPDVMTNQGAMADIAALGTPGILYVKPPGSSILEPYFKGYVKTNPRVSNEGGMQVTLYEPHHALLNGDLDWLVADQDTGGAIITAVCHDRQVPTGTISGPTTPLGGRIVRGMKVAEFFKWIFDQTAARKGGMWFPRSHTGVLDVVGYGSNTTRYRFTGNGLGAISSQLGGDITKLVTKVSIYQQGDDELRSSLLKTIDGLTQFGPGVERIIYADDIDDTDAAVLKARLTMATEGFPVWVVQANSLLVHDVYKGDLLYWQDRLVDGAFYCMGVTKDFTAGTMQLDLATAADLERMAGQITLQVAFDAIAATKSDTVSQIGHEVIKHALKEPATAWTSGGTHGGHPAVDIFCKSGEPVLAPEAGIMESMPNLPQGGNAGVLKGESGKAYYFAHCKAPMKSGRVSKGATIGNADNTGNAASTATHLHFAIASNADVFNQLNGSGDIQGDSSYWVVDPPKDKSKKQGTNAPDTVTGELVI